MRIYKRGNSYILDSSSGGVRTRKSLGPSKEAAEQTLAEMKAGDRPAPALPATPDPAKADKSGMIFDKLCDAYLEHSQATKVPQSHRRDRVSVKNLLRAFKGKPIKKILPYEMEQYMSQRRKMVKPATVNRELSCIKHMLNKAVNWRFLKYNALDVVKKFKEPPGRVRWLTTEEANHLIANCRDYLKPIVITALNTGMRKGELLRLEWNDVDLANRLITVRNSKNNESRSIPINETLYHLLADKKAKTGFKLVFCHQDGSPFHEIYYGFIAAVQRAGLSDFHFHDLRHTFASWLVMQGVDIRVIQVILGHKTIAMTMRYSHVSEKTLREAVEKIASMTIQNDHFQAQSVPKKCAKVGILTKNVESIL